MNSINIQSLRFPIIFDPYSGYINDERNNKCAIKSAEDRKLDIKQENDKPQGGEIFITMVCHQIQQFVENDGTSENKDDISQSIKEAANINKYTHHLGLFVNIYR